MSVEPQYGQRKVPVWSWSERRLAGRARRGRGEARLPELLAACGRDPVGRPGVVADHLMSGSAPSSAIFAASASRMTSSAGQPRKVGVNPTCTRPALDADVTHDAEVDERDDRDLRVGDLRERLPDLGLGHHAAPGTERRTTVISSHRAGHSSTCVPRSTASTPPCQANALGESRPELRVEDAERVREAAPRRRRG